MRLNKFLLLIYVSLLSFFCLFIGCGQNNDRYYLQANNGKTYKIDKQTGDTWEIKGGKEIKIINKEESKTRNKTRESLATTVTTNNIRTTENSNRLLAKIKFREDFIDFGNLNEGDKAVHSFYYTNIGSEPFTISNVKGSDASLTPDWSREELYSGQTQYIKVQLDTKGLGDAEGNSILKRVNISGNTETGYTYLTIKAQVFD